MERARRWGSSFGGRLTVTVLVTVAAIGAVQYAVTARALRRRVVAQEIATHSADATVLANLYSAAPPTDRWAPVNELLNHIATRPGIERVAVIDPHGAVLAVGQRGHGAPTSNAVHAHPGGAATTTAMPMHSGHPTNGPTTADAPAHGPGAAVGQQADNARVTDVLTDGQAFAEVDGADDRQTLVVVPVDLPDGRHALEVVKSADALVEALADLRVLLLLTLGLGVTLAAPLFYLVGGRSLSARHGAAVEGSTRDGLTGLRDHRVFHEELRRAMAEARRHGTALALALVDLDSFKAVNDGRGHRASDRVLSRVAAVLSSGRPGDLAFRVGGDEFAIVMPMTGVEGAQVATDRIRRAVEAAGLGVTTSVGIAVLHADMTRADHLIDAADKALYRAKNGGRNRVVGPAEIDPTRNPAATPVS